MNEPSYRMLAVDLDGTLTTSDKTISPRTRRAVWDAIDAGTNIVLASGRPLVAWRLLPMTWSWTSAGASSCAATE